MVLLTLSVLRHRVVACDFFHHGDEEGGRSSRGYEGQRVTSRATGVGTRRQRQTESHAGK